MNSASWCYPLSGVVSDAKLLDTRLGRGIQLSWPTSKKTFLPLLPIDNCFVRGNVRVLDRNIGPSFGSDHFPIIADFAVDNR
jgi:endonuclease/exonuclease/phosphatase (EEP) superfamily protein YafD